MSRLLVSIAVCSAFLVFEANAEEKYANYYAGKAAAESRDCNAAVTYLNAFLADHPYVKEKYRDFYLEVRLVIEQCTNVTSVRGIGGGSDMIDPMPAHTPMEE